MQPMIVLTAKKDGGTQNVHGQGFYRLDELRKAMYDAEQFMRDALESKRAIVRIELYNPQGHDKEAEEAATCAWENEGGRASPWERSGISELRPLAA
jgi:hypothetical protein